MPTMVTTGSIAFRSTCVRITVRSGAPLARAVRTKSMFIVSITSARTKRTYVPATTIASVEAREDHVVRPVPKPPQAAASGTLTTSQ